MFIYKRLPQNFKVRRLTFRNILKRTKTGVFQRTLTLFHRHYSLERNKKICGKLFWTIFRRREQKKSKQIGQEKVALMITGAGVVARKLTFSNNISELLDGTPPAPWWLFHYITVTSHACMRLACRVQWSWVDRAGDTVKQSQRRVTSPTVIEACLLTNRSKMFRQHLKCSLTASRRAGTSSGFFLVSFNSTSCLSLGDLVQRCLGQPVDLLAPWPSATVIPRRRSTAVHFQSVERRVQRNLEGLANVRLDELTVVRRHWLSFFF